jgi:hypothetical protein
MTGPRHRDRVLSIYPHARGFTYTVFEGPMSPVDWGMKQIRGDNQNARCLATAKRLIEAARPAILALEKCSPPGRRRATQVGRLQRLLQAHAASQAIDVRVFTRKEIHGCFEALGATTRYERAQVIASQVTAFSDRLPPPRKTWMPENPKMRLFDAAAVAMAAYCRLVEELAA